MTAEQAWAWGTGAFEELYGRIEQACAGRARAGRCSRPSFFELERAELTAFVPVAGPAPAGGRVRPRPSRGRKRR